MLAVTVDTAGLARVVWVSLVAGVGLTLLFSLAIAGAARAQRLRRDRDRTGAAVWTAATALCGVVCAAAVVAGVVVMLKK